MSDSMPADPEPTDPNRPHLDRQLWVRSPGWEPDFRVELDELIAPLIVALWAAGIQTRGSYEGHPERIPPSNAWVRFEAPAEVAAFLRIAGPGRPGWSSNEQQVWFPQADLAWLADAAAIHATDPDALDAALEALAAQPVHTNGRYRRLMFEHPDA